MTDPFMAPDGILFDMDGLLLDTERVCMTCFTEIRRQFSLPDNPEVFLSCVGLSRAETEVIIRASLNAPGDSDLFNATWNARIAAQLEIDIPVKAGALALLERLAAKGYPMAVATMTQTTAARAHLEHAGLLPFFEIVIGGDQVQTGKPDPEIYHKAAAHLGLDAARCITFEDSNTGTKAAVASGARTIQIPDLIAPSPDVLKLGHLIANNLLEGALQVGLLTPSEV